MDNKKHTPQPITVMRDGEIDPDYMPKPPTLTDALQSLKHSAKRQLHSLAIDVQARAYDARHGTDYARIRRQLLAEKRERRFIDKIGLVPISH